MEPCTISPENGQSPLNEETLRAAVLEELSRSGMSQTKLAKESGINQARLSQWLGGKYRGDNQAVARELDRWLKLTVERREQKVSGILAAPPEWQRTPSAKRILDTLRFAQANGDITLIYGGAGVGKTCTANQYRENNLNVWIATMSPALSSVTAVLERVCASIGILEIPSGASRAETAIVARLTGSRGLLIVDEARHLAVSGVEALRSIHDASGIGLALIGNETVYARITGGSRKANFAQLFSRIGYRVNLSAPSAADVETILDAWHIQEKRARRFCSEIAARAGALRSLTKVLRIASMTRETPEEAIDYDMIQVAWLELGGTI